MLKTHASASASSAPQEESSDFGLCSIGGNILPLRKAIKQLFW
jgi:hypothetical protein